MDTPTLLPPDPARAAGLTRLADFAPRMGRRYASGRNHDRGPGRHSAVSGLSPYVRRRLVTEAEIVAAAVAAHGIDGAEKFIQEVLWRSYFRGWLERRPGIWADYRDGLARDLDQVDGDRRLRKQLAAAEAGATGLDCFDAWAVELVQTGYLHNHARMWFASIWIFTLGLPWRIGADFFLRHLIDGCPASNTLGWRWVGGLHTPGKTYRAAAWNIAKFTDGRFAPRDADLADDCPALVEPGGLPDPAPVPAATPLRDGVPTGLLITEEDGRIEDLGLPLRTFGAAATLHATRLRSPRDVAEAISEFDRGALDDAASRAADAGAPVAEAMTAGPPGELARWATRNGLAQIVTPYVPQGPVRDWLDAARPNLTDAGVHLAEPRRAWDDLVWPHTNAGFFKVKKQIPRILGAAGIDGPLP